MPDDGQGADLLLDLEDDRVRGDRATAAWPLEEIGYRTATAHAGSTVDAPVVYRAARLFYSRPNGLLVLDRSYSGNGDASGGLAFFRSRAVTQPIDLAKALADLGFALGPPRLPQPKTPGTEKNVFIAPPPHAQDAAYVASLLALGSAPGPRGRFIGSAQVVNDWHQRLLWKEPITTADRTIFCASFRESSIQLFFWVNQLRNKGVSCD